MLIAGKNPHGCENQDSNEKEVYLILTEQRT